MASEVTICNLALTRLGHNVITTLDEGSVASDLCSLHYSVARDAVLRAHPWNFAIRRATLALSATTPNHEFIYQHALPSDPYCLKVIRTDWEADGESSSAIYGFPGIYGYSSNTVPYRIEGRFLLCNESTVKIEYIARITDTAQFDDLFTDVLAQRLAAEMGIKLTDNQAATKTMWDIYSSKLVEARMTDAQEGSPRDVVDLSPWISVRV
jgi:hypothetical protein